MVKIGANLRIACAALALSLAACTAEPRCEPVRRCNVRAESCQQQVLRHAACLRGESEPESMTIPVRVMERDEYVARAAAEAAEESEAHAKMMRGLSLFGFYRKDGRAEEAARSSAALVGAYYDSDTRSITLLDDGRETSGQNVVMLVHEMLHALQDASGQLSNAQPLLRLDQALAYDALVEGEATILEDESAAQGYGYAFEDLDYAHALVNYRRSTVASALSDAYPFVTASMRFPYAFGASYLWALRAREGWHSLATAFADPPISTSAVMVRAPTHRPGDLGGVAVPVLSELGELELVGTYHLGRFLYQVGLGSRDARLPSYFLPTARHFVADTISVFTDRDGGVLAVYRVRFAGDDVLRGAAEFMAEQETTAWMGIEGRDLWWAEAEGELPPAPAQLRWEAAPERDFGFDGEQTARRHIRCLHPRWRD